VDRLRRAETKIPPEKIAEVRERADIERVVSRYVRLTKKGRRHVGLCPFHSEKTPSFGVSADKQLYHCFGCQAGGDVIDFVRRIDGLEFIEAIRQLAAEFGIPLPEREETPKEREVRSRRDRMFAANRLAAQFYAKCLERVPEALAYVKEQRELTDATIEAFCLGWAPDDWQALSNLFKKKGIDPEIGVALGLLGQKAQTGRTYDRLRGRIVFPIEVPGGVIAGFGARRADWIDADAPKYLNSPESPVYDKSSILYGLSAAKNNIRRARSALLVEGYLDVIPLVQAGFGNVVAGCGTALTLAHARALDRVADEVVTLYDGDNAGLEATSKAAVLLLGQGLKVRVAAMPRGEDPDTFVRKQGADSLKKLVDQAPSAIDFFVRRARSAQAGGGIAGTTQALDAVKPMILAIKDPLERDVTLQATARALRVEADMLRRHLGSRGPLRPQQPPTTQQQKVTQTRQARVPQVEMAILKMVLEMPTETLDHLQKAKALQAFTHDASRTFIEAALHAHSNSERFDGAIAEDAMRLAGAEEATLGQIRSSLMNNLPERDPLDQLVPRLIESHKKAQLAQLKAQLLRDGDLGSLVGAHELKQLMDPAVGS
jgi:DNA primase